MPVGSPQSPQCLAHSRCLVLVAERVDGVKDSVAVFYSTQGFACVWRWDGGDKTLRNTPGLRREETLEGQRVPRSRWAAQDGLMQIGSCEGGR